MVCPICNNELSPYDKKYCNTKNCAEVAKAARARVEAQNRKFDKIMGRSGKQRHIKFKEEVMSIKTCIDCGENHNKSVRAERCAECAKKRRNAQCKVNNAAIRPSRKPCRECGGKIGPDRSPMSRFCSDECRDKKKETRNKSKKVKRGMGKPVTHIDPKWLSRGAISTNGTGVTAMGA